MVHIVLLELLLRKPVFIVPNIHCPIKRPASYHNLHKSDIFMNPKPYQTAMFR